MRRASRSWLLGALCGLVVGAVVLGCTQTVEDDTQMPAPTDSPAHPAAPAPAPTGPASDPTTTEPPRSPESPCETLAVSTAAPVVADPPLLEISGAVISQRSRDAVWVHEDSGNAPTLVELGLDGVERSRWMVPGVQNVDWEDIAAAVADDGRRHLFVGDIGDNRRTRAAVQVLRVPEPGSADIGSTEGAATITLVHPIEPADVESLLVDPLTGDLVLLTKELSGASSVLVARGAAWAPHGTTVDLEAAGTLRLGPGQAVLAADLSPSGRLIAVRTPFRVLLWSHSPDAPVVDTLLGHEPCRAPSVFDPFGEAIALLDQGYVLVGEGDSAELVIVR